MKQNRIIEYNNQKFYVLEKKRKNITIKITPPDCITIFTPLNTNTERIIQAIKNKYDWIKKIKYKIDQQDYIFIGKLSYITGEKNLFLNKKLIVKVQPDLKERVMITDKEMIISSFKFNNHKHNKNIVSNWLKNTASKIFQERLDVCFQKFITHNKECSKQIKPNLKIKKMKSRWGSLNKKGIMTLNLLLIHLDITIIDHVIIHELSHLIYFNHSKKFYHLFFALSPNWKKNEQILKNTIINYHL